MKQEYEAIYECCILHYFILIYISIERSECKINICINFIIVTRAKNTLFCISGCDPVKQPQFTCTSDIVIIIHLPLLKLCWKYFNYLLAIYLSRSTMDACEYNDNIIF